MLFKKIMCILFLFFLSVPIQAQEQELSINLANVPLSDAIRLVANSLGLNVILNPAIQSSTTLQLQHAQPKHVLNLLLKMNGLAKWRQGNVWYVSFRNEVMKRSEEEYQWQDLNSAHRTHLFKVWQINYGKARDIASLLKGEQHSVLSKDGMIRVDQRTNRIFVYDTKEKIKNIAGLIKSLDIPIAQVMIEARVVSMDQDCERELGLEFATKIHTESKTQTPESRTNTHQFSIAIAKLADHSLLDVKLAALEREGRAELISTPSLFTGNLETASIEAGEEVPYQEVSESGGTAVVFKKAVLGLKVTPQILPHNNVLLHLQVNQDRPSSNMVLGVPTISTRQITTHILARAGHTIVLGGIYETNHEKGVKGIAYLSRLPVVGALFRQQTSRSNKRELLIFVTPRLT